MPRLIVLLVGALLLPACAGDSREGEPPESIREEAVPETEREDSAQDSSPQRAVLPVLFSIMAGLEGDMARVSRGLWLEDLDSVATGADAIATHPRVPPEEFQRISGVLGEEMSRFGGMDMKVHDLAVRLADEARRGELEAVLSTHAELQRACITCHSTFRERLREGIR